MTAQFRNHLFLFKLLIATDSNRGQLDVPVFFCFFSPPSAHCQLPSILEGLMQSEIWVTKFNPFRFSSVSLPVKSCIRHTRIAGSFTSNHQTPV